MGIGFNDLLNEYDNDKSIILENKANYFVVFKRPVKGIELNYPVVYLFDENDKLIKASVVLCSKEKDERKMKDNYRIFTQLKDKLIGLYGKPNYERAIGPNFGDPIDIDYKNSTYYTWEIDNMSIKIDFIHMGGLISTLEAGEKTAK